MSRARIAVLASGGGSNLQALLDHLAALGSGRAADVVVVASDRATAGALERARRAGVRAEVLHSAARPDGRSLERLLRDDAIDLVVLAGYLKFVPREVTQAYAGRMVNVHPALLPAFGGAGMYGARVHRAVLAAGARWSGPTVHFVDDVYDHGAVIAQWPVPVLHDDDEHTLAARVLRAEHLLYPRTVQAIAAGALPAGASPINLPPFDPALPDDALARVADAAFSP